MAYETLLSRIPVPKENIYRMKGEKNPQDAAHEYDETLRRFFQLSGDELPRFGLIFLGLGEDGHTASLFPGSKVGAETKLLVAPVYVEKLKTYRLTLTLPLLNHGARVFFLVGGEAKASALRDVLREEQTPAPLPAQLVKPINGSIVWLVDQAAARLLSDHLRS
jgi:6-phosphogluconolactonase